MFLRALGSLLIRRSSLRGIRCAQAPAQILGSASGRPPRSLHILRDLDAGVGTIGALAAGGLAALVGILYFLEDESGRGAREVTDRKGDIILDETIRATFMDRDGNFAWLEYIDYINFRRRHPEVTDPEVLDKMLKRRYTASDEDEAVKQDKLKIQKHEGVNIDDEVMKARFEDWMKEYDKAYPSEEEKARRCKVFKENAMAANKANGSFTNGAHLAPNNLGDWTKGELYRLRSRQGDFPSESYFRRMSKMYAEGRVDGVPGIVDAHDELECTEAVKQRFRELTARKAEQDARKAEQDAREAELTTRKSQ